MSPKKVCVNASNLHNGGGIQVATSFIDELSRLPVVDLDISVFVSSEVAKNLKEIRVNTAVFSQYRILNSYGLSSLWGGFQRNFNKFDLVFTVFGPAYFLVMHGVWLTGFAQAWIVNIDNEVFRSFNLLQKFKNWGKFYLQAWFFRRSGKLIVELDHVKHGLIKKGIAKKKDIYVVYNCISSIYFEPEKWRPVPLIRNSEKFSIGFVGRDYAHKNVSILLDIKKLLACQGVDVDFYVTLTSSEWSARSGDYRSNINNVGELTVAQCPSFYQLMDAVIFPSMLECFSATPLEAMIMRKPLFASDREFVRDVCGDFAWYFDPVDPASAAAKIMLYLEDYAGRDVARLENAREHAANFSNAKYRAEEYIKIIRGELGLG